MRRGSLISAEQPTSFSYLHVLSRVCWLLGPSPASDAGYRGSQREIPTHSCLWECVCAMHVHATSLCCCRLRIQLCVCVCARERMEEKAKQEYLSLHQSIWGLTQRKSERKSGREGVMGGGQWTRERIRNKHGERVDKWWKQVRPLQEVSEFLDLRFFCPTAHSIATLWPVSQGAAKMKRNIEEGGERKKERTAHLRLV